METGNHFKNGASPKNHTSREKFRITQMFSKLSKIVAIVILAMIISGVANAQTEREKQQAALQVERAKLQAEREKLRAEQQKEREKLQKEREKLRAEQQREREKQQAALQVERVKLQAEREKLRAEQQRERVGRQAALSEFEIEMKREFTVGSSPSLSISNQFGRIRIIEGTDDKIVFKVNITGKGKDASEAKKIAESIDRWCDGVPTDVEPWDEDWL